MFDEKLKKLEELISSIENGSLGLEDSVKAYQEASALIKELEKSLNEAKEIIVKTQE